MVIELNVAIVVMKMILG